MGWQVGMAILDAPSLGEARLAEALGLSPGEGVASLSEMTRRDVALSRFGVGRWGASWVVVHEFAWELSWEALPEAERVFVFLLSENRQCNHFEIWERGQRVRLWDEWDAPGFEALHALEEGLEHEGVHPADRIGAMAERALGVGLFSRELLDGLVLEVWWRG